VDGGHERRQFILYPEHLVERVIMMPEFFCADNVIDEPAGYIGRKQLGRRLMFAVIAFQNAQVFLCTPVHLGIGLFGFIA
jgi:hypothetical protein